MTKYVTKTRIICKNNHDIWPGDEVLISGRKAQCPECNAFLPIGLDNHAIVEASEYEEDEYI